MTISGATVKHGSSGLHIAPPSKEWGREEYAPIILLLTGWLDQHKPGALDQAVENGRKKLPDELDKFGIHTGDDFLRYANELLTWIPHENQNGKDVYDTLCIFYFILDQEPLKGLQTPTAPESAKQRLRWLSNWIVTYAQIVGLFMDTPESITTGSFQSFLASPSYRMGEAKIPEGGFKTFNEFFARRLKDGCRPIAGANDPGVIVYPADSTFDQAWQIDSRSYINVTNPLQSNSVNVKGIQWDIRDLLHDSHYADKFENGIFMHMFLNTYNYHRQHAPVSGAVLEARVIQGAAYMDVEAAGNQGLLKPKRGYPDPLDAEDNTGYQFLQARGLIVINSRHVGLVAVLPIGMAQVSSVKLSVKRGDWIHKGGEISYFQFGGSDCVVVFQQKSGLKLEDFPLKPETDWTPYGSQLNTPQPLHLPPLVPTSGPLVDPRGL